MDLDIEPKNKKSIFSTNKRGEIMEQTKKAKITEILDEAGAIVKRLLEVLDKHRKKLVTQ